MDHLEKHSLLSGRQHAFRKKHSCETQLVTVINDWAKILDKDGQVVTFILDFEKAFDTPPHELKIKIIQSLLRSYAIEYSVCSGSTCLSKDYKILQKVIKIKQSPLN